MSLFILLLLLRGILIQLTAPSPHTPPPGIRRDRRIVQTMNEPHCVRLRRGQEEPQTFVRQSKISRLRMIFEVNAVLMKFYTERSHACLVISIPI